LLSSLTPITLIAQLAKIIDWSLLDDEFGGAFRDGCLLRR